MWECTVFFTVRAAERWSMLPREVVSILVYIKNSTGHVPWQPSLADPAGLSQSACRHMWGQTECIRVCHSIWLLVMWGCFVSKLWICSLSNLPLQLGKMPEAWEKVNTALTLKKDKQKGMKNYWDWSVTVCFLEISENKSIWNLFPATWGTGM